MLNKNQKARPEVTCRLLCDNTLSVFFNRLKIDTNERKYVLETEKIEIPQTQLNGEVNLQQYTKKNKKIKSYDLTLRQERFLKLKIIFQETEAVLNKESPK